MATIFSKIISGEIPCYKIAEDEAFFAFLDIRPLAKGHTLVVPKKVVDYLFDLAPDELGKMMAFAQKIAKAQKKAIECKRVGVLVIGTEVPHAHIHLIPFQTEVQMSITSPKLDIEYKEMERIAQSIRAHL